MSTLFGGWLAFNAAFLVALYFRRPNPELHSKLFTWVVRSDSRRRLRRLRHHHSGPRTAY
jgi:hypothetical protein